MCAQGARSESNRIAIADANTQSPDPGWGFADWVPVSDKTDSRRALFGYDAPMASVSRDECTQLSSPRDTVSRAHDDHHRDTQQETLALIQPFGADGDEQVGPTCCYSITSTFGETPEMQAGEFGAESAWLAPEMCVHTGE
ncbi:uncharacterized protein PSANT_06168 [Moesziomyces antarcticus]|uniref:Uncharacterized protein n=1 Tax=Pseudozyma antarctica TaxID=84753 RepID=A0A5C3FYA9_PSEA2|nr:uncharacterized protein PSANT_06168 [Moesziomyces antarcticus]